MPLRASSFRRHELLTIIFITDLEYIKNEWEMLSTFPDIYILDVGFESGSSCLICLNSIGFADQPVQFETGFDL